MEYLIAFAHENIKQEWFDDACSKEFRVIVFFCGKVEHSMKSD